MAQTEISELQLQPSEEAETRRKLPKIDENVLASVPGDLQLLVMSDEEEEPAQSVQPIREDQSDPVPWFWCRGDLGTALSPLETLSRGTPYDRSRGRPRGRSRGRGGSGEVSLCRFCGRGFKFRSALEMHMRSHTGERPFTCTFCGRGFSLKGNLKTHLKTHLNGAEPDLNRFILDQNRTPPMTSLQNPPMTALQNPRLTPLQTPAPITLQTPILTPPPTPIPTLAPTPLLTPPLNPLLTLPLNPLRAPLQSCSWSQSPSRPESRPESKPLQCPVCSKTFSWRSTLSVHMRVHTGERPYSCTLCDKRFSLKGNLKDHMRRHLLEKRHLCTFCGLGFDYESLLLNHLAVHTAGEEGEHEASVHEEGVPKGSVYADKRHVCPFCGLGFDQEHLYFRHLTVHTAGEEEVHEEQSVHKERSAHEEEGVHTPAEDKPLICPFCGLQFEHKSLLLDHITVHTTGEEEEGEGGEHENQSMHEGSVYKDQRAEEENDDDDDDDDDDGEEEVFFAITVQ